MRVHTSYNRGYHRVEGVEIRCASPLRKLSFLFDIWAFKYSRREERIEEPPMGSNACPIATRGLRNQQGLALLLCSPRHTHHEGRPNSTCVSKHASRRANPGSSSRRATRQTAAHKTFPRLIPHPQMCYSMNRKTSYLQIKPQVKRQVTSSVVYCIRFIY